MNQSPELNPVEQTSSDPVAESFLACLKNARHETSPFDYWLLENPLPEGYCDTIANLPFPFPEGAVFNGPVTGFDDVVQHANFARRRLEP